MGRLSEIADALEEEAAAADWLGGQADQAGEPDKADECHGDADTMRRWANLNRKIEEAA